MESLKQIRQRVQWGLARAEAAVSDFGGDPASPPVTSALGHLRIANEQLTKWINAGVSAPPSPAAPEIQPEDGTYTAPLEVTMSAEDGAEIRYTVDGSTPSDESPVYTGPVILGAE